MEEKEMEEKVLIIDDDPDQYALIKKWVIDLGYEENNIIPNENDKSEMTNISSKRGICQFVEKQINMHYKDLVLILCDIKFGNDRKRGNQIVKHIRQLKNLYPSNWASMVPIIGMTEFSDNETSLEEIIRAGADYAFDKEIVIDESEDLSEERDNLTAIIETQITKFQTYLDSIYPPKLKEEIYVFKNRYKNKRTAFIMTDFRHLNFAEKAKSVLYHHNKMHGKIATAPGGENHGRIWENIEIFMNGCDFGICIYSDDSTPDSEGNKRDKMNANVSIEVGYMLGLQKNVCFLKHDNLTKLPSDFDGENYLAFSDEDSLEIVLIEWLKNRGFIEESVTR